ncbi:IucA/IucC family C-terminal-domain containing protein [Lysinibacillus halotolerans]|uniref:Iron reductase n=1 Tax=Lysinibacillus halotolerans TaxID=1368476 RepID=A0A3M8H5F3_9BACI|nr:IucA/IucC family C-terminal-domain containing protein [Lysinibacillus halotolerans]RNC97638.1 iron reductase [Lysinibacillus halotolerans]
MNTFSPDELKILEEKFRLTNITNTSPLSIQISHLLDEVQIHLYLTAIKEKTKAANLGVAASLFVKRYSFAILTALYSMSVLNKRIDFSFQNVSIQTLEESDPLWLPSIKFNNIKLSPAPQDRENWRNEILTSIFANHLDVLFNLFNKTTKISKMIMWENLYLYIVWMYQNLLDDKQYSDRYDDMKEDFDWITAIGKGMLFGEYKENPFLKFRGPNDAFSILDGPAHNRKTCCLSYLTENKGRFCKTCPIRLKRKS